MERTGHGNFVYASGVPNNMAWNLTRTVSWTTRRTYAISVKPPKVFPGKPIPRIYPPKKATLYHRYMRLLESTQSSTLIFLLHADFTAQRLLKLRKDIIIASGHVAPSLASLSPKAISPETPLPPTLTILRTAIFGAALRDFSSVSIDTSERIESMVKGGLAVLVLPKLDPPQLSAVLRALERGVPPRKPKTAEELEKERQEKNADPVTPGRRIKKVRSILQPELKVVGALIERRLFTVDGLRDVSKLPTLGTLRAQIVGLLSSPATQLAAVLSEASGRKLARTLEGFKKSLEEDHNEDTRTP
jgi:ribosomal protein L10